jgi:hypothetical protein
VSRKTLQRGSLPHWFQKSGSSGNHIFVGKWVVLLVLIHTSAGCVTSLFLLTVRIFRLRSGGWTGTFFLIIVVTILRLRCRVWARDFLLVLAVTGFGLRGGGWACDFPTVQ